MVLKRLTEATAGSAMTNILREHGQTTARRGLDGQSSEFGAGKPVCYNGLQCVGVMLE